MTPTTVDPAATSLTFARPTTAERVAETLRELLLSGVYAPGTPMRDVELSGRAGVSRTTMREALALLAREGLLTHSLHRGMEVTRLTAAEVRDIYAARRVLESAGIAALLDATTPDLGALTAGVAVMAEAAARRDMRLTVEADGAFHLAIVEALGNRRLTAAERGALSELRLVLSVTDRASGNADDQVRQHQALLAAVREQRPTAVALLEHHLADAESLVCGLIEASRPG